MKPPYRYHVLPCTGKTCGFEHGCALKARFKELLPDRKELGIRISTTSCQGMCELGPNVIVYPEGFVYRGVQITDVERIVREHLRENRPIKTMMQDDQS